MSVCVCAHVCVCVCVLLLLMLESHTMSYDAVCVRSVSAFLTVISLPLPDSSVLQEDLRGKWGRKKLLVIHFIRLIWIVLLKKKFCEDHLVTFSYLKTGDLRIWLLVLVGRALLCLSYSIRCRHVTAHKRSYPSKQMFKSLFKLKPCSPKPYRVFFYCLNLTKQKKWVKLA